MAAFLVLHKAQRLQKIIPESGELIILGLVFGAAHYFLFPEEVFLAVLLSNKLLSAMGGPQNSFGFIIHHEIRYGRRRNTVRPQYGPCSLENNRAEAVRYCRSGLQPVSYSGTVLAPVPIVRQFGTDRNTARSPIPKRISTFQELYLHPDLFFMVLVPPIALDAGYSLHIGEFIRNIGAILTYAVFATVFNTAGIGKSYGSVPPRTF